MIPEISTIFLLIGIIVGIIFYLDSWRNTTNPERPAEGQRLRGLIIVVGGGIVSPIIDNFVLTTDKYDSFRGYLFGVIIGWLISFITVSFLYVIWKNSKKLPKDSNLFKFGQIAYSFLEVMSKGIDVIEYQQKIESQEYENELVKRKQKLKEEDPKKYIKLEEQSIQNEQRALENQKDNLENLKLAIDKADNEPEQEAERLIQDKNKLIKTLQDELKLAQNRYDKNNKKTQNIVDEYKRQLKQKTEEVKEIEESLNNFRNQVISQSDFSKLISFKRINEYEFGGLFIGQLTVQEKLIKIYQGDITNLITDVIVSSDDNYLSMGGGVSYRIRCVGGNEIYDEARKLIPLSWGDVAVTTAGRLPSKKIFHGVVIDFDSGKGPSEEIIEKIVHSCIEKANKANYQSIAFPLLGTGTGGFSSTEALKIILSQTIKNLSDGLQNINEIIIVIYGGVARVIDIEAIIKEFKNN